MKTTKFTLSKLDNSNQIFNLPEDFTILQYGTLFGMKNRLECQYYDDFFENGSEYAEEAAITKLTKLELESIPF